MFQETGNATVAARYIGQLRYAKSERTETEDSHTNAWPWTIF